MAAVPSALPPGFVDILTAKCSPLESSVSIIGIVVDVQTPILNRSNQWQVTFNLQDVKHRDSLGGERGFTVRFFRKTREELPSTYNLGDIVLLRYIRIREWQSQRIALSNHSTRFVVFPSSSVPAPAYATTFMSGSTKLGGLGLEQELAKLSNSEQAYIISIKALFPDVQPVNGGAASARPTAMATQPPSYNPRKKFKVIRELQHWDFADLVVEVVKKYEVPNGDCELYVTDYSMNKEMFYYKPPEESLSHGQDGDVFGYNQPGKKDWPGPFEWYVLKVNLKQPHAAWANQHVEEAKLVSLQNVKCKVMAKLEGDMWHDDKYPDRVRISHIKYTDVKEVQELLSRKKDYWSDRKAKGLWPNNQNKTEPAGNTKSEKKRLKKQRWAAKKASGQTATTKDPSKSNAHVRCGYQDQPTVALSDIIDAEGNARHTNTLPSGETYTMPFINAQYRTTARVVDFWPNDLEDFVVLADSDPEEKSEFSQHADWGLSQKWEWSFSLQLQDLKCDKTLWANVGHHEAQMLLGNSIEDPSQDLHGNSSFVNKLREKMCILWGDLEEKKRGKKRRLGETAEDKPSNMPFEMCLSEYGVLAEGAEEGDVAAWEKQFMMHSVTIS